MKIMSNPPILKYSNFYNAWVACGLLTGDLKVQVSYSLKFLANFIWFTLLFKALLSCWVELKYI